MPACARRCLEARLVVAVSKGILRDHPRAGVVLVARLFFLELQAQKAIGNPHILRLLGAPVLAIGAIDPFFCVEGLAGELIRPGKLVALPRPAGWLGGRWL